MSEFRQQTRDVAGKVTNLKKITISQNGDTLVVSQRLMGYDAVFDITPELKEFILELSTEWLVEKLVEEQKNISEKI